MRCDEIDMVACYWVVGCTKIAGKPRYEYLPSVLKARNLLKFWPHNSLWGLGSRMVLAENKMSIHLVSPIHPKLRVQLPGASQSIIAELQQLQIPKLLPHCAAAQSFINAFKLSNWRECHKQFIGQ